MDLNQIIIDTYSWGSFLMIALLVIGLFLLLQLAEQRLTRILLPASIQVRINRLLHKIILVYEPVAAFILISVFVLVDPFHHGLFVGLILLVTFPHFKNYMSGRLAGFNSGIKKGELLRCGELSGIISKLGRLGLYLQTHQGNHFVSYSNLLAEGYTLISEEEIGGFYHLNIQSLNNEDSTETQLNDLSDRMVMAPYQAPGHKPELFISGENSDQLTARVMVKEERHLQEFISLIMEWGYTCSAIKTKQLNP